MICFLTESSCRWVQKLKVSTVSVIYFSTNIWSEFVHFCEHLVTPHLKLYFIRLFVCPTVFTDNGHEGTQWTRNETPWKIGLYNRITYIEYSKPLPEPLNEPDSIPERIARGIGELRSCTVWSERIETRIPNGMDREKSKSYGTKGPCTICWTFGFACLDQVRFRSVSG